MDDPWSASGPSWSTPSKASSSRDKKAMQDVMRMEEPPVSMDVSDPWGGPTVVNTAIASPRMESVSLPNVEPVTSGWGYDAEPSSGWGDEPPASVTTLEDPSAPKMDAPVEAESVPPPRRLSEATAGGWGNGTKSPETPAPVELASPPPSPKAESPIRIPLPTSPSAATPPRSISFTHLPPFADEITSPHTTSFGPPSPSLQDEGGFGTPIGFSSTALPASNSFGDFTTFDEPFGAGSGSDPWGGGGSTAVVGGWGGEEVNRDQSGFGVQPLKQEVEEEVEEEEGEGWGGARSRSRQTSVPRAGGEDDHDWESAQRRIRIREERAPMDRIDGLQSDWKEVAAAVIGLDKLIPLNQEEEAQLDSAVRKLTNEVNDTVQSLSSIPSNIDTHIVLSTLSTHQQYISSLSRPNPSPSTSLLTPNRRTRQTSAYSLGSGSQITWQSRSQLGEPDAPSAAPFSASEEVGKAGWSFWKKSAPPKALVTSGGGALEIKALQPEPPISIPNTPAASIEMRGSTSRTASVISPQNSRPASPAISVTSVQPPAQPDDVGHTAPSEALAGGPAPSAVSRFFGRLSRKPSSRSQEVDSKDLELSADDFSFLEEVPSITYPPPERGIADLLSLEGDLPKKPANLEALLSSKPVSLPGPLAPPPRGPSAPSYNRTASGSSNNRFVAKMKTSVSNDMDLLGGLDFDGPSDGGSSSQTVTSPVSAVSSSAWDDFLAPSQGVTTPPIPGPASFNTTIPSVSKSAPLQRVSSIPPPSFASPPKAPPKAVVDDFGDFDDFNSAQHSSTSFDDFGDFSTFDSAPQTAVPTIQAPQAGASSIQTPPSVFTSILQPTSTPPAISQPISSPPRNDQSTTGLQSPPRKSLSTSPFRTPAQHRPTPLDHTPTISLISGASATKGRRWPAPPSPIPPSLDPPPKAGGGFPFLSPPPAGSSRSASPGLLASNDLIGGSSGFPQNGASTVGLGSLMAPTSSASLAPPMSFDGMVSASPKLPAPTPQAPVAATQAGKAGLSAQDLSFFDSL